jgi:hypothetical protein
MTYMKSHKANLENCALILAYVYITIYTPLESAV